MTLLDLRLEYRKDTGDQNIPLSGITWDDAEYVSWLEDQLLYLRSRLGISEKGIATLKQFDARFENIRKTVTDIQKERFGI
jgi:hypothetical protein